MAHGRWLRSGRCCSRCSRTSRRPARRDSGPSTTFLAADPDVVEFARFRAAGDAHGVDWHRWPVAMRDGSLEGVDAQAVRYHGFVQWLAHDQLVAVARRSRSAARPSRSTCRSACTRTASTCGDTATSSCTGSRWAHRRTGSSPAGSAGGSRRPTSTLRAAAGTRSSAPRSRITSVSRECCRIDHVLGLQRLFCVPDGAEPAATASTCSCPLEELLAVVAIEAQRHHAAIVGEDLGTVDAEVRRAMARDGIRRSFVIELSVGRRWCGHLPRHRPRVGRLVHDPRSRDLRGMVARPRHRRASCELGQVAAETGAVMHATRRAERGALATLVDGNGSLDDAARRPPRSRTRRARTQRRGSRHRPARRRDRRARRREPAWHLDGAAQLAAPHVAVPRRAARVLRARRDARRAPSCPPDGPGLRPLGARGADRARRHATRTARRPPVQRGSTREALRPARRPCHDRRRTRGDVLRSLGPHGRRGRGRRGLQRLGRVRPTRSGLGARRGSGRGSSRGSATNERYKFRISTHGGGGPLDKADPFARRTESPPLTASVTTEPHHRWGDDEWMRRRGTAPGRQHPDLGLRGAPRFVATGPRGGTPAAHVPRARSPARRVRAATRVHPRRAAARDGAPLLRVLGLPGDRLLRARPRATATPTTSPRSSTSCTRRASA